ncbi:zinc-binding dehydrogenase [Streptomyces decoyicus]|uniref:zinc-binding dehydrogenase n=1 Tax=Streptomyces decoyicus TaxID=249567 RepID=UPI0033FD0361
MFVSSGLKAGSFRPVVDRNFTLDDIVAKHRYMEAGTQVGKIVVKVGHGRCGAVRVQVWDRACTRETPRLWAIGGGRRIGQTLNSTV